MAFLIPPLAVIAFVFVEAEAAVSVLLGDRWLDAIPIVRIMCAAAFFDALSRLTMWLYTAEGRTRQQFHWSAITTPVMLLAVGIGATRGVTGVAWAFAADDRRPHDADRHLVPPRFGDHGARLPRDGVATRHDGRGSESAAGHVAQYLPGARDPCPGFCRARLRRTLPLHRHVDVAARRRRTAARTMRDGLRRAAPRSA